MKTSRHGSNLSDYYAPIKLNPVGHDIAAASKLRAHESKRRNLVEHHLKLPLMFWKDRRVIEFGPASGENAAVLARAGARMTFVEPLDYLISELKSKFSQLGLADRIESVHQDTVEHFKTSERYEAVYAEGFIQFLEDAPAGVRKLSTLVTPGGFLVTSMVEPAGTFIEFVKKSFLELAAAALHKEDGASRLELARSLFGDQFSAINHSRAFEKWAKDTILNPLYRPRYFLDLPSTLAALPGDFVLHASWPNYLDRDDLVWHKNLKSAAALRAETLRGYYARAPHFLHSIPHAAGELPLFAPDDGKRVMRALHTAYAKMERALVSKSAEASAHIKGLAALRRALAPLPQSRPALEVVDESLALFRDGAKARDEASFVKAWKSRKLLHTLWGSPGHHFAFQRTDLFS